MRAEFRAPEERLHQAQRLRLYPRRHVRRQYRHHHRRHDVL
jgi:hypothetical protein